MTHQVVGYIRVSSVDQNPERQLLDIPLDKKFIDTVSGGARIRPQLEACMDYVREGDILYVDSIDRLARNLHALQEIVQALIKKGVIVKFVKEGLTFTTNNDAGSILMLQMMGAFAEFERTMIRARQKEGIAIAKKAGKHLGRPAQLTANDKEKAKAFKAEGLSIRRISLLMQISRPSVYKLLDIYPKD